jgi:hypothetical protein
LRCENRREVVTVGFWAVAANFDDLGDESRPWPALQLNEDVQRVSDIALDGSVWQFDSALEDTTREPGKGLRSGACMNRRKSSRMASVQQLEQVKCLAASNFAKDDAVGPVPQKCLEQVSDRDGRQIWLRLACLEAFDGHSVRKIPPVPTQVPRDLELQFEKQTAAWENFNRFPPFYRRMTIGWVASAKKDETKLKRLNQLIQFSARNERIQYM